MKIFPVFHVAEAERTADNAARALDMGADGVYLQSVWHRDDSSQLFSAFNRLCRLRPEASIGLALRRIIPISAFIEIDEAIKTETLQRAPDAFWSFDASAETRIGEAKVFRNARQHLAGTRYLGEIAGKRVLDEADKLRMAKRLTQKYATAVDTVTTTGERDPRQQTPEKIIAMKQLLGDKPLAVTSGVNHRNLGDFYGYADDAMILTSFDVWPRPGGTAVTDQVGLEALIDQAGQLSAAA